MIKVDIIYTIMRKIINLILIVINICLLAGTQEDDIIDISQIPVFPQGYSAKIRAGYLSVTQNTQSFYYILAESQSSPDTDPLILWLNGGPGCSSLTGFFTQNGPFTFIDQNSSSSKMKINDYRWNKKANILYLESPGGVGFSKANPEFLVQNDTSVAKNNLIALIQFFTKYKKFGGSDFYIAGQSYAGIYIPQLAKLILDYNQQMQQIHINLMGMLIGNACTMKQQCTTPTYYSRFTTQFFYTRGFIEDTLYNDYKTKCLTYEDSQENPICVSVQRTILDNFLSTGANIYNLYAKCYTVPNFGSNYEQLGAIVEEKMRRYDETNHGLKHPLRCTDAIGPITILNTNQFRAQFKVDQKSSSLPWTPCSDKLKYTMQREDTYGLLPELIKSGIRIFYFSGDLDAIVPITGTVYWFDKFRNQFGQAVKRSWRPWITKDKLFANNQNISGMVWELGSMTLATVRGAGHMVPSDKPAEAEQILNVFLDPQRGWNYPDYYIQ